MITHLHAVFLFFYFFFLKKEGGKSRQYEPSEYGNIQSH